MEKDKTDLKVERYIADAFVRKGEQEAIEELAGIESVDKLKQIMTDAEHRHHSISANTILQGAYPPAFRRKRLMAILMSVAAVIVILMFVGLRPRYSTDELYARWYIAIPYESVVIRGGDDVAEAQQKSLESAIALACSGKTEEAIETLLPIATDEHSEIREDAQWQLTMLYLKLGKRNLALQMLQEIVDNGGAFSEEGKELINEMNKKRWF